MRPMQVDFFADMEDQGSTVAMDVDDVDALEITMIGAACEEIYLALIVLFPRFKWLDEPDGVILQTEVSFNSVSGVSMHVHLEKELDWVLDMVQSLLLPVWKLWNIPRNQAEHYLHNGLKSLYAPLFGPMNMKLNEWELTGGTKQMYATSLFVLDAKLIQRDVNVYRV
ncbi:hypothetical protein D5086_016959 [Populus alba]|uniref:Uncharacterized protein n=1 Tax=Populus alba TaxID=43335 RepID=A0ACC4BVL8_POPAL